MNGLSLKKQFFSFLILISFAATAFGQKPEARMIDEFGNEHCSQVQSRVPAYYVAMTNIPDAKIHVIYYEGKHLVNNIWNKKLKIYESKWVNPRRGNALNRAKEIELIFKDLKVSTRNLVLVDGGFRENFFLEVWLVTPGAEPPKPTPTLSEKDITFEKGKPVRSRYCARIYDGL